MIYVFTSYCIDGSSEVYVNVVTLPHPDEAGGGQDDVVKTILGAISDALEPGNGDYLRITNQKNETVWEFQR